MRPTGCTPRLEHKSFSRAARPRSCRKNPSSGARRLSTSQEFCLSAVDAPSDCESVQFIAGMTLNASAPDPQLVISFGTNDCESRFVGVRIDRIWQMLRPMREAGSVCSTS